MGAEERAKRAHPLPREVFLLRWRPVLSRYFPWSNLIPRVSHLPAHLGNEVVPGRVQQSNINTRECKGLWTVWQTDSRRDLSSFSVAIATRHNTSLFDAAFCDQLWFCSWNVSKQFLYPPKIKSARDCCSTKRNNSQGQQYMVWNKTARRRCLPLLVKQHRLQP